MTALVLCVLGWPVGVLRWPVDVLRWPVGVLRRPVVVVVWIICDGVTVADNLLETWTVDSPPAPPLVVLNNNVVRVTDDMADIDVGKE